MNFFATAFSDRSSEEAAVKELCRDIKNSLPQWPDLILVLYSQNYKHSLIYNALQVSLRPKHILAVKAPLIIHQKKVSERGIALACFHSRELTFNPCLLHDLSSEKIEVTVRKNMNKLKQIKLVLSFISPFASSQEYLRGIRLALGKNISFISAGFKDKEKSGATHYLNTCPGNKVLHLECGGNLSVYQKKITGFIPLCRPFALTRIDRERNIILEINNRPAAEIYKKYLEEKYDLFQKQKMFKYYPLGVETGGSYHLITIKNILGDDSLLYEGNICQKDQANLMIYNKEALKDNITRVFSALKPALKPQLLFVVNSSLKQHFYKKDLQEEMALIKKAGGEKCQVIGLYSNYLIAYNNSINELIAEEGSMNITFINAG